MRQVSMEITPIAMLSRQLTGVRNKSLIMNLPGNPKAIKECLEAVFSVVPACIEHLDGFIVETHEQFIASSQYLMSNPKGDKKIYTNTN